VEVVDLEEAEDLVSILTTNFFASEEDAFNINLD
jgi:hypothetical protein